MSFRPRYSQNIRKTGAFMKGTQMQALVRARAEEGARYAEATSPRESGEYATSFRVDSGVGEDRAEATIVNTADYAAQVELRHRVLAQTVDRIEKGP